MQQYEISILSNDAKLYVDMISSPAGHYLNRRPYIINILKELIKTGKIVPRAGSQEIDTDRIIGNTDIIDTTDKDIIYYAKPYKKNYFIKFAKNRYPLPSTKLSIILKKDCDNNYLLQDVWIGSLYPKFPDDQAASSESILYWNSHALAQDSKNIQSSTITKICPY